MYRTHHAHPGTQEHLLERLTPTALLTLCLCFFVAGIASIAVVHTTGGTLTPAVVSNIAPSPQHLPQVMETAALNDGHTSLKYTFKLPPPDKELFKRHFKATAPSKGWYPHGSDRHGIKVVLPAGDLPQLKAMANDPRGWAAKNAGADITPRGPSALNFVNAEIEIKSDRGSPRYILAFAAAFICWMLAFMTLATALTKWSGPRFY